MYSQVEDLIEDGVGGGTHNPGSHGPVEGEEGVGPQGHRHKHVTLPSVLHRGKM